MTPAAVDGDRMPVLARLGVAPFVWSHTTHTLDDVAGYVVRLTVDTDGQTVRELGAAGPIGRDIAWYLGAENYGTALEHARRLRGLNGGRSYAVVDSVYVCGCRLA